MVKYFTSSVTYSTLCYNCNIKIITQRNKFCSTSALNSQTHGYYHNKKYISVINYYKLLVVIIIIINYISKREKADYALDTPGGGDIKRIIATAACEVNR